MTDERIERAARAVAPNAWKRYDLLKGAARIPVSLAGEIASSQEIARRVVEALDSEPDYMNRIDGEYHDPNPGTN